MDVKGKLPLSLLFISLACPSSYLLAKDQPRPSSFGGWIGGIGLGATEFMANNNSTTTIGTANIIDQTHMVKYGAMGSVFVGGNWVSNRCFLMGLELGLNVLGSKNLSETHTEQTNVTMIATDVEVETDVTGTYTNSFTTQNQISRDTLEPYLDLKLGFVIASNALLYAKGGISYNSFEINSIGTFQATGTNSGTDFGNVDNVNSTSVNTLSEFTNKKEKDKIGIRVGGGLEHLITPQLGLAVEYVYTFYQHFNRPRNSSPGTDVSCDLIEGCVVESANFVNSEKATLSDQRAMIQLLYHFD